MAKRYSKVICPGALTPTEVLTAWDAGADIVKVFPCGNVGGAKYIKALKGPFPQIEMIPTGGVNLETAGDFLKAGACAVAVGGELVDAKTIKEGRYEVIEQKRAAVPGSGRQGARRDESGVGLSPAWPPFAKLWIHYGYQQRSARNPGVPGLQGAGGAETRPERAEVRAVQARLPGSRRHPVMLVDEAKVEE